MPVPREQQLEAFQLMHEGDQMLRDGKDHLALLKYLEASQVNPYHEAIFNKLAISYSRLQMFPQAENAVKRSIGLNRSYPYAHNTRGIIELSKSNYRGAARYFHRAIELKPTVANFYLNLGYALVQDGKFEEGLVSYRKGLDLQPEVLDQAAFIEITHAASSERDIRPRRLFDMARLFARLGQPERCIEYLGRAISAGFTDIESIYREEDFRQVRDTEEFKRFMTQVGLTG